MVSAQNSGSVGAPLGANRGGGYTLYANPPFDKRITAAGAVDSKGKFIAARNKLYRGRLESVPDSNWGSPKTAYQLYFLYNPMSVTHSSAMNTNYLPMSLTSNDGTGLDTSMFMEIGQTINFVLLFDRTYETWNARWDKGEIKRDSYVGKWGVLADMKVLFSMLGMYGVIVQNKENGEDGKPAFHVDGSKSVNPMGVQQITPTGAHSFRPCWAIFGPLLKYYGNVTSLEVTYDHFTQDMVPNRCTVNVGFQLLPLLSAASKSDRQLAQDSAAQANAARGGRTGQRPYKPGEV